MWATIPAGGNCWGMQVNTQKNSHCCWDLNVSLVCFWQVFPRNSHAASCSPLHSWHMRTQKAEASDQPSTLSRDELPQNVNSWNLILKQNRQSQQPPARPRLCLHPRCTSYPINLLQQEHGTVSAEVLWQYGVSLPLRRGRHLSAEEEAVQSLGHQSQTKTRRPAKIPHI